MTDLGPMTRDRQEKTLPKATCKETRLQLITPDIVVASPSPQKGAL
jgi:hypothetical protein